MDKKIDVNLLRSLKDTDMVPGEHAKIFNFMFKKNKISWIKFEINSKISWTFPFSKEFRDYTYDYTEPSGKFLKLITETEVKNTLTHLNKMAKDYYYHRFRYENSKEFPNFAITKFALYFIFLGFILQLWRLFNLENFDSYFNGDSSIMFYIFLIPWGKLTSHCFRNNFCHVFSF